MPQETIRVADFQERIHSHIAWCEREMKKDETPEHSKKFYGAQIEAWLIALVEIEELAESRS